MTQESEQAAESHPAEDTRIVFYCKDCDKIIDGVKIGRKYVYQCPICGTKNVAFGTYRSVKNFYRLVV